MNPRCGHAQRHQVPDQQERHLEHGEESTLAINAAQVASVPASLCSGTMMAVILMEKK
jgi:hypothetical protein